MLLTPSDYDVVVVGARAAGASTAMLLAQQGHRVLLLDRARLPSEIAQGHFIYRHGPRRLQKWGLLDRIVASGSPPVTRLSMDLGDFPLESRDLSDDGVPWGIGPRRGVLDKILLEAAIDAGVEVLDEVAVTDVLTEDGRVTGVRGRSGHSGASISVRARLTIGADGRRSRIAQAVHAPMYEQVPTLACWYFSYWSGVPMDGIEILMQQQRAAFVFPTNDHLTAVFVAFPVDDFPRVRLDPERNMQAALDLAPELGQRVHDGRREERLYGTADLPNFMRKPYGPGWALVGDAGCHKDPMLALGVCHALHDAELLAEAADEGLSGRRALDDALTAYEVRRNAATLPDYYENLQMARLEPAPAEVLALRAALRRGRPEDSRQFALANFGVIPREAFFNPNNLGRIMTQAPSAA
jgi:2-polyprenyl-6-methoxyphenol hydroxylase-like FAD-dependent oxidoreductase